MDVYSSIDNLGLSTRSYNALRRSGINTINQLLKYSAANLKSVNNIGDKSFNEIQEKLLEQGWKLV